MSKDAPAKLHIRIVTDQRVVLGWGRADLLSLIAQTGSIAAAGRAMGMSYKRAWELVETMNEGFAAPLVVATKGGAGGGGAQLTELGLEILTAYREIEAISAKAAVLPLGRIAARLKANAGQNGQDSRSPKNDCAGPFPRQQKNGTNDAC